MNSPEIMDLENYTTKIKNKGIKLEDISDNPFDHDIGLLLNDIKDKAFYPIYFENFDPKLLELMN